MTYVSAWNHYINSMEIEGHPPVVVTLEKRIEELEAAIVRHEEDTLAFPSKADRKLWNVLEG